MEYYILVELLEVSGTDVQRAETLVDLVQNLLITGLTHKDRYVRPQHL